MSIDARRNFALSSVAVAPTPAGSGLALDLDIGGGSLMPTPPFNAVCWPEGVMPSVSNAEIVRVESITGDSVLLSERAAEEPRIAQQIAAGWQFADMLTAKTIEDLKAMIETETTRAEAAEAALSASIVAEAATRAAAVTAAIGTAESVAEGVAATTAAGYVAVETTRAEAAEAANATAITAETTRAEAAEVLKAPLANPALTGVPTAPTAAPNTNTTQIATTAAVHTAKTEAEAAAEASAKATAEGLATAAKTAAEAASIPATAKGAASGVAELTAGKKLLESELPESVVSDSRGSAVGDLLVFDAENKFVRLPHGQTGQQIIVTSTGEIRYEEAPSVSVDAWGAKGEIGHDDHEAFAKTAEALEAKGGGVAQLSAKKYETSKWASSAAVSWVGAGVGATQVRGTAASANLGLFEIIGTNENYIKISGIQMAPQTAGQHVIYAAPSVQLSGLTFENCELGAGTYIADGVWLRAGTKPGGVPIQFVKYINTTTHVEESETAVALKCTGQVEKIETDLLSVFDGKKSTRKGHNIELGREFLLGETLKAEAKAAATTIELETIPAGLNEKGKELRIGCGRKAELVQVESVSGKVVTLKAGLEQTHAAGAAVFLLSGTVAEPATLAPSVFSWGGTFQNADLHFLVEKCDRFHFDEADCENQNAIVYFLGTECQGISGNFRVENNSEGKSNGEATATAGSTKLTGATSEWKVGENIAGPGVPLGATVTEVEGSVITISGAVEGNGTEAAQAIPLTKGGKGEGYVIRTSKGTEGEVSWEEQGPQDRGMIGSKEASLRGWRVSRGTALAVSRTVNNSWEKATAEALAVSRAGEVLLTDTAHTIKTFTALHAPGEMISFVSKLGGNKFETGGNLSLAGKTSLTLEKGDRVTFVATDRAIRFEIHSVHRAAEEAEPTWTTVEEINAKLEAATGFSELKYQLGKYEVKLTGAMTAKEAIPAGTTLFKLPSSCHPKTRQNLTLSVEGKYAGTVEINGEVKNTSEIASGKKVFLSGENYTLQV